MRTLSVIIASTEYGQRSVVVMQKKQQNRVNNDLIKDGIKPFVVTYKSKHHEGVDVEDTFEYFSLVEAMQRYAHYRSFILEGKL